jgi:hypothetical protein
MKMAPALGGDVRELMSTARALWDGIDALHDDYLKAASDHEGELPVVVLSEVRQKEPIIHQLRAGVRDRGLDPAPG